jgi:AcrR family transcriptional regulator
VTDAPSRPLRADAARAAERIVTAARQVYAESGPDAPLEEIAQRAGVGIRTLYRRFPTKGDLALAALNQTLSQEIAPVVGRALQGTDTLASLTAVIEAGVALAGRDLHLLAAVQNTGCLTPDVYTPYYEPLAGLVRRGQAEGVLRPDLHPDDLPRIMVMLISALITMPPGSDGWRRYLALMTDAISTAGHQTLPAVVAPLRSDGAAEWSSRRPD